MKLCCTVVQPEATSKIGLSLSRVGMNGVVIRYCKKIDLAVVAPKHDIYDATCGIATVDPRRGNRQHLDVLYCR